MRSYIPVLPVGLAAPVYAITALFGLAARALKELARARANRRAALVLSNLDRTMLKDIGITRSDLNDAFSSPFWEDPTALLRERAIERRLDRTLGRRQSAARHAVAEAGFVRPRLDRASRLSV
jgi:uncharacterized protein YjiS (DUF1127 family)